MNVSRQEIKYFIKSIKKKYNIEFILINNKLYLNDEIVYWGNDFQLMGFLEGYTESYLTYKPILNKYYKLIQDNEYKSFVIRKIIIMIIFMILNLILILLMI